MNRIIRGAFNDTPRGRMLAFFAGVIDRALDDRDIERAIAAANAGASIDSDPQWKAVAGTLGRIQAGVLR